MSIISGTPWGTTSEILTGTDANDSITGANGGDVISGGAGNDTMKSGSGNDTFTGGSGADLYDFTFTGTASGHDIITDFNKAEGDIIRLQDHQITSMGTVTVTASGTNTVITYGDGQHTLTLQNVTDYTLNDLQLLRGVEIIIGDGTGTGTNNSEWVLGNFGNDTISGQDGHDTMSGGNGHDSLSGGSGDDQLSGDFGSDTLHGGAGNDFLYGGPNNSGSIEGSSYVDVVTYDKAVSNYTINTIGDTTTILDSTGAEGLDTLIDIELLQFTDLTLAWVNSKWVTSDGTEYTPSDGNTGGGSLDGYNVMMGTLGNDVTTGTSAADYMSGGNGDDYLDGSAGADSISGDYGNDTLTGGGGNDTIDGGTSDGSITGASYVDRVVYAGALGNYTINVNGTSTTVTDNVGGEGIDLLTNIENIQFADQTITWSGSQWLNSAGQPLGTTTPTTTTGNATDGADSLQGASTADNISAGAGNDTVTGNDGNDLLQGNQGNDSLTAGTGNDTVYGGKDSDYVQGNQGSDYVNGNNGSDTVYGGKDADTVHGGKDADLVNGNIGNDIVYGDLGNDTIHGGQDEDSLLGGEGNDVLYGDKGNDTLAGEAGADIFVFTTTSGIDQINDFQDGIDLIQLSGTGLNSTTITNALTSSGGNTVLTIANGVTVTLVGIDASLITASDFQFV